MKSIYIILAIAVVLTVRLALSRTRRNRRQAASGETGETGTSPVAHVPSPGRRRAFEDSLGDVGKVAAREVRERIRGRIFRVGTLIMLVAVGAAVVIPTLHKGGTTLTTQVVGVVGSLSPTTEQFVHAAGSRVQDKVTFVQEASLATAHADLRSQIIDIAIVNSDHIVLSLPAANSNAPADPTLLQPIAQYLGAAQERSRWLD